MQTLISQIAFCFADDAAALVTGFGRLAAELARDLAAAARARVMAPVDRLARACDVAGTLSARPGAATVIKMKAPKTAQHRSPRGARSRFDVLVLISTFRTLRDLT